jgi:hypothetical protein
MLAAAVGEYAPAAHRARTFAVAEMVGGVAISLGPVAAAPLFSQRPRLPFEAATILALVLIPTLLVAQRRARRLSAAAANAPTLDESDPAARAPSEVAPDDARRDVADRVVQGDRLAVDGDAP